MTEMLGRLRALGAPMDVEEPVPNEMTYTVPNEMTYTVQEQDGHAHVVYTNNKDTTEDTYRGGWKNGKMNGYGTFTKNQVTKYRFDWQFSGQFANDCATSGQLSTPADPDGESKLSGTGGKPIYEWDPFKPTGESGQGTRGPIKADQQLQAMQERRAEQKRKKDAEAKAAAKEYNTASDDRMNHGKGWVDRYGRQ
jgi:hypothetical protein